MINKKSGYTLVELIISFGIFTVVMGSLFSLMISQNSYFGRANARLDVNANARKVMMNIVKEVRMAKVELVNIYDQPLHQGAVTLNHINGRSISFQVPVDWDSDGDVFNQYGIIEWGADDQLDWSLEYYYDNANNEVVRRVWNASSEVSAVVIAVGISAFNIQGFRYNTGTQTYESLAGAYVRDIVEITVTAQKNTLAGRALVPPIAVTLSNKIYFRN